MELFVVIAHLRPWGLLLVINVIVLPLERIHRLFNES